MKPLQGGLYPLGQYDLLDTELASITGGEVVTFTRASRQNSATEKAAQDAVDGYLYDDISPFTNRPAVVRASTTAQRPLFLVDDGTTGYGTLFGETVGAPAGLSVSGSNLGPHTAAASGKVTLWDKPGLYSVSVSSLASDFVSTLSASGMNPGLSVGFESGGSGKLAHNGCTSKLAASGVARAVEFESSGSLVTTPQRLVGAAEQWPNLVISFHAGLDDRTL